MILFVHGAEPYLVRQKVRQVAERARERGIDDLSTTRIDAEETAVPEAIQAVQASGLFAAKRLVIIRNWMTQRSADEASQLVDALGGLDESTIAVVAEDGEPDRRRTAYKQLTKLAEKSWELGRLDEAGASRWVSQEAKRLGARITPATARELVGRVGADLWSLASEVAKLATAAGSDEIDPKLIRQLVTDDTPADIFALVDAVGRKDGKTALSHLGRLLAEGEPPLRIFAMLVRQLRLLLAVQALAGQQPDAQLAKLVGAPPFVIRKLRGQADYFTERELRDLYSRLAELDHQFKTGRREPEASMELFITEVCGVTA